MWQRAAGKGLKFSLFEIKSDAIFYALKGHGNTHEKIQNLHTPIGLQGLHALGLFFYLKPINIRSVTKLRDSNAERYFSVHSFILWD